MHAQLMAAFAVTVLGAAPAGALAAVEFRTFDPAPFSQSVSECDRQASHPEDPFKVLPGLEQREVNLEAAIAACRADLEREPANPRLQYQLGRVLTYAGRVQEALPHLEKSAAANYPQSLFVTGFVYLNGSFGAPQDACRAGELIRESAVYGRLAGLVGFPAWTLEGRFRDCPVKQDGAELEAFLLRARGERLNFYQGLLVDVLLRQVQSR
jgi:tetratricopeptide (TPR) repeat protein